MVSTVAWYHVNVNAALHLVFLCDLDVGAGLLGLKRTLFFVNLLRNMLCLQYEWLLLFCFEQQEQDNS